MELESFPKMLRQDDGQHFIYTKSAHATMQVQNIIIGPHLHLTDTHWETVEAIHKILKPVMVLPKSY